MALVESIHRGLDVLRIVNMRSNQNLSEIAGAVALPRGTTYRLLITLEDAGFIERRDNRYRVTQRVCALSHGFDDNWIDDVAHPVLVELGDKLHWPISMAQHQDGFAVVRANTDSASTMTLEPVRVGTRLPMLGSAAGRILLAYAPTQKQKSLFDYVLVRNPDAGFRNHEQFGEIAEVIRSRGYDIMPASNDRQMAFAVPVSDACGVVQGALSVRYFKVAMNPDDAIDQLAPLLNAYAARIGKALGARERSVH